MNKSSVIGKILIKGKLILKSPLLIGDGAGETADNFRDAHVVKNRDGKPFIPGTSLCGVLRDWLKQTDSKTVTEIFGDLDKMQSSIQVDDIELVNGEIISRDGVKIDGLTGTGVDGGKFDYEAIERGASGKLRILINLRGCHSLEKISDVVARMLKKLQDGIRLGALTTKGFGLVTVEDLNAGLYDFHNKADVAAWLQGNAATNKILPSSEKNSTSPKDFVVDADFVFNSSFIVRDYDIGAADKKKSISAVTMKSREDFVIPGTSIKGILRHRAEYIFAKLGGEAQALEKLMGCSLKNGEKIKSRFIVSESYVAPANFAEIEHRRNKIDRITGGTLQGMLFATKPAYSKKSNTSTFKLHFEIREAEEYEAGLAIFLLRDLWFGRVAIGGEKSIGRGTVKGLSAEINFDGKTYKLDANGKVIVGDKAELENFAAALKKFAGGDGL
ncbi:MAG: CRISPR-associated protein [Selenomonadaceae bacterium]|nr:CRISPR-associated protein [Selenomonadaceae bacterium]